MNVVTMESPSVSSSSTVNNCDSICKLCENSKGKYVCPKCGILYCSLSCYKSSAHLECSEMFYKQCVEEELKIQQDDPEMKQKTLDMLQRVYNQEVDSNDLLSEIMQEDANCESDDGEENLDSDDENIPSLEKRLENIDLEDANQLWSALTADEKQKFEALIQSGEAIKLLPSWNPWWNYSSKKKLIKDVNEKDENETYRNNCPQILCISALNSKTNTSPFVKFGIINTVYAYAYTVMHLNGEHHSTALDSVFIILRICETLRINKVFKDITSAIESVLLEITNCESLPADEDTILETKKAGDAIIGGPEEENKCFYVLAALSDLHQLLLEAVKEISIQKSKSSNQEFNSKFQSNIDLGSVEVSRKYLKLLLKKIEFYIACLKLESSNYDITGGEKI